MSNKRLLTRGVILVAMIAVAACGDDPVRYSDQVGINLKAKSADTVNGVVSDEKGITTESGNPYGAFVSSAREALGGAEPSSIRVEQLELFLGAGSTGVTALGEIFDGSTEVLFEMNDTNNTAQVGTTTVVASTTSGPVAMSIAFSSDALGEADYTKLLGGSFKVSLRGPAATGFQSKGADANIQLTFTFGAYE
jgi:hypothetical protein